MKKDIRAFLGLVGYCCKFIQSFADVTKPITEVIKKDKPDMVGWTAEIQSFFDFFKDALSHEPVLTGLDFEREFTYRQKLPTATQGTSSLRHPRKEKNDW